MMSNLSAQPRILIVTPEVLYVRGDTENRIGTKSRCKQDLPFFLGN